MIRLVSRRNGFLVALLLTAAALLLSLAFEHWLTTDPYPFFFASVMLTSWVAGLGPGLLAAVLGTVLVDYFFIAPLASITFDAGHLIHSALFLGVALVISYLNGSRRRAMAALDRAHTERVKELTAVHRTVRLLYERRPLDQALREMLGILPPAWQYPDILVARIAVADQEVSTAGFRTTPWMQRARFSTSGGVQGSIEVAYLEEPPSEDEGPFLLEERWLIDSLASLLRAYFEHREAEREHEQLLRAEIARQEAQQANLAKDHFLAVVSHELRTPLNVVLGWIHMLRGGRLSDAAAARGLEIVDRNVKLQAGMIEELLDLSRIVTGKLQLDMDRVDLGALASTLIEGAQPEAHTRRQRLDVHAREPLVIRGDARRLHQCLSNLLSNAMKFTPEGGAIDLDLERSDASVVLTLTDTGIGIQPDRLPFVFDPFYQAHPAESRQQGGLGLGLSIVRRLIELHAGTITATSAGPGHGTRFTITLPLQEQAREEPTPVRASPPSGAGSLQGVRVLVVEDERDTRVTLQAILENSGAQVIAVGSAEDGLRVLTEQPPDLLVSDIAMPGMDGYALMQRVRALESCLGLPAVALTAQAGPDSRRRAQAAGFHAYLEKPVEPAILTVTLAHLLNAAGSDHPPPLTSG